MSAVSPCHVSTCVVDTACAYLVRLALLLFKPSPTSWVKALTKVNIWFKMFSSSDWRFGCACCLFALAVDGRGLLALFLCYPLVFLKFILKKIRDADFFHLHPLLAFIIQGPSDVPVRGEEKGGTLLFSYILLSLDPCL